MKLDAYRSLTTNLTTPGYRAVFADADNRMIVSARVKDSIEAVRAVTHRDGYRNIGYLAIGGFDPVARIIVNTFVRDDKDDIGIAIAQKAIDAMVHALIRPVNPLDACAFAQGTRPIEVRR